MTILSEGLRMSMALSLSAAEQQLKLVECRQTFCELHTKQNLMMYFFLPDPRGAGLQLAFQFSYVRSE